MQGDAYPDPGERMDNNTYGKCYLRFLCGDVLSPIRFLEDKVKFV